MKQESSPSKLPISLATPLILTFCAISMIFIYLLASKNVVIGSKVGNWYYSFFETKQIIPLWVPVSGFFLIGLFIFIGNRWLEKYEKLVLLVGFIIAVAVQAIFQSVYYYSLDWIVRSDGSNSFLTPALQYSPSELLSQFVDIRHTLPIHAKTNMPGKIVFFQILTLFTKDPQIMGYMIIAVSTLGGLLLYAICQRLFHNRTVGLYAFILYALIPAKQEFLPILNTVTPVFILASFYIFLVYLDSRKQWLLGLLGVSLYILFFFEPTPLVMGLLFVSLLGHALIRKKISPFDLISITMITLFAFGATHILFKLVFQFDLFQTFQALLKDAQFFNVREERHYAIWVRENAKEFFFAVGLPVVMVILYNTIALMSHWNERDKGTSPWTAEVFYLIGVVASFLVLNLLGVNRGETTRLWIYLAAFFQVPAAYFLANRIRNHALFFILACTLMIQSLYSLQRIGFLL